MKGDKARSGFKNHFGQEGGQIPLYKKLPTRGFSNARFKNQMFAVNLKTLNSLFADGETVSLEILQERGLAPRRVRGGLKILSGGELTKKVTIKAHSFSQGAEEKLNKSGVAFQRIEA